MAESRESDSPTRAVALNYEARLGAAPFVSAAGSGALASQLVEIARAHNIPIVKNPPLTAALSHLQIREAIPEELYEIVAHILVFVYTQMHSHDGGV